MDFDFSPDQMELAARTLEFAKSELNESVIERDASHKFGLQEWQKCGRFGLLGAPLARESGGLGLDCLTTARVFEAFGNGCRDGGLGMSVGAHLFASVMPIARFGTPQLKDRYLRALASGEKIAGNAITEANAGSDVFALTTRAKREGEFYRLSGEKAFVTNGPIADVLVVYAMTDPALHLFGITAFLVERETKGIEFGRPIRTIGLRTSPKCSIRLHGCLVPKQNRLGAEGQGGLIFNTSMNWERTCLFAFWLGAMERNLEDVIQHAKERVQFGRPIGMNQAVSHRIANMKIRLESARLLLYRACWGMDAGRDSTLNISIAKVAISEAAVQSSLDSLQLFGALGVTDEIGVERLLRDSVAGTIYSGTSEIQRDIIARHLGLPRRGPGRPMAI